MSRSYRKPYSSVTGNRSAKDDKIHAHRGMRRAQNQATRQIMRFDDETVLMPKMRECSWNNVYSWSRDGRQRLRFQPVWGDWFRYWRRSCFTDEDMIRMGIEEYHRQMECWIELHRK